ncbi:hypothetical protein [Uliginosibacterium sediminicola]|uniref:BIG2 domain-containing protein n=1 Tax=Uliginosibacterium sediminicola TaxID=2024550 RepID=A0ABU9YW81_9RHOO
MRIGTSVRSIVLSAFLLPMLAACGGNGSDSSSGTTSASSSSATSSAASSSSSSSSSATASVCPTTGLYFCDDFQAGNSDKWDLTPGTGSFAVVDDPGVSGNKVLQYTAGSTNGNVIALLKDSEWTKVTNKADYYVEARIKPQINSTTGNKQLFLIGRYQDATNWYLGGLNVQNSTGSTQVEAGYMKAGTISRTVQAKRAIIMGNQGSNDGQWYTVRYEMIGSTGVVYLDGEKIGTVTDSAFASGKIGLFTANKSFLIDDIKVGDPSVKPVQLTLSPSTLTYSAEAGDAAYAVTITATKNDGVTADTFTAVSSDKNVVSVSTTGNVVTITPVGAGTANIVFTSGSDATVTRTIVATIAAQFVQPTATYTLTGKTSPVVGETAAYIDGKLTLTFDATPVLGSSGSIRIFKTSDNSLVDVIKTSGNTDSIGLNMASQTRGVATNPIKISGNTVTITPHNNVLAYGTNYYVAIANGVLTGKIGGTDFVGLGKTANWNFTTKAAPSTSLTAVTVDDDGTADFRSVQGALNYAMKNVAQTTAFTVNVKNGTYEELMFLRNKDNLTIKGESRTGVVIQYDNYETLNSGSGASASGTSTSGGGRAVFLVEGSDLLTLDTLTLKNTHIRSTVYSNQAETIYFNNDAGRLIAKNAEFYSEQDTLQLRGYTWFYNTLVAGNVDYIWGQNRVALFENSEIRTLGDSQSGTTPSGGYILQSRTTSASDKGFVFLNSSLTYGVGPGGNTVAVGTAASTYLARAAAGTWVDNILFISCKMDTHITALGWAANISGNPAPNPSTATASSGWREYKSTDMAGNLLDVSGRSSNSRQMTDAEITASYANRAAIFSAFNSGAGWSPVP